MMIDDRNNKEEKGTEQNKKNQKKNLEAFLTRTPYTKRLVLWFIRGLIRNYIKREAHFLVRS